MSHGKSWGTHRGLSSGDLITHHISPVETRMNGVFLMPKIIWGDTHTWGSLLGSPAPEASGRVLPVCPDGGRGVRLGILSSNR